MEELVEKLSTYNIINNLIPGAVFCYFLEQINNNFKMSNNTFENIFVYYFFGMIISRIGSIIIEPICKKIKFVKYAEYSKFIEASKEDEKIDTLSEVNNMYRTFLATFISLGIIKIYYHFYYGFKIMQNMDEFILYFGSIILFLLAYRKQVSYIKKRVDAVCTNN